MPGIRARSPGAAALSARLLSRAWMVRVTRGSDEARGLVVHLYPVDAFGIDPLDAERLRAAHADHEAGLAAAMIVAGVEDDEPLVARLSDQRGLRVLRPEAERHRGVRGAAGAP